MRKKLVHRAVVLAAGLPVSTPALAEIPGSPESSVIILLLSGTAARTAPRPALPGRTWPGVIPTCDPDFEVWKPPGEPRAADQDGGQVRFRCRPGCRRFSSRSAIGSVSQRRPSVREIARAIALLPFRVGCRARQRSSLPGPTPAPTRRTDGTRPTGGCDPAPAPRTKVRRRAPCPAAHRIGDLARSLWPSARR